MRHINNSTKRGDKMKKCIYCNRMVEPVKKVDLFPLLFMTFITCGGWLFIYLIHYLVKDRACPICGGKDFEE